MVVELLTNTVNRWEPVPDLDALFAMFWMRPADRTRVRAWWAGSAPWLDVAEWRIWRDAPAA